MYQRFDVFFGGAGVSRSGSAKVTSPVTEKALGDGPTAPPGDTAHARDAAAIMISTATGKPIARSGSAGGLADDPDTKRAQIVFQEAR